MALLVTGNWYQVEWLQTNNAAWAALLVQPGIPAAMMAAFVNAATMTIYVTDSASGAFVFAGGTAYGFDDTLLVSNTALTGHTLTATDANTQEWAEDVTGATFWYDAANATIREYDGAATAAFKAFLP